MSWYLLKVNCDCFQSAIECTNVTFCRCRKTNCSSQRCSCVKVPLVAFLFFWYRFVKNGINCVKGVCQCDPSKCSNPDPLEWVIQRINSNINSITRKMQHVVPTTINNTTINNVYHITIQQANSNAPNDLITSPSVNSQPLVTYPNSSM